MVAANSINESTTGIVGFTGTAFTATAATQYAVLIGGSTSSTLSNVGPTATAGQVLQSAGNAANPSFSTPTYPSASGGAGVILRSDGTNNVYTTSTYPNTNAVSTLLYASSANVMSALATVNRASLSTNSTGVPTWLAMTDGQLVIGSTAGSPAAATLSAGTGITITNASNSITIAATSGGFTWSVKSTDFSAVAENGYFITGNAIATLPASPNIGDTIEFFVQGAFTVTITGNTGQKIQFATNLSSSAGTQANTASGDSCKLVYDSTGTQWNAVSFVGAWNKT